MEIEIRRIEENNNKKDALKLVLEVFMEFEAKDYEVKGVNAFKEILKDRKFINSLKMFGAYNNDELVGVIALRSEMSHIALFFVKANCHKKGIGKKLFTKVLEESKALSISVNSSPYAVKIYKN